LELFGTPTAPPGKKLPPPPKLACPPGEQQPGLQCCPTGTAPGADGQCKPWCPSGAMDPNSQKSCRWGFDPATMDPANPGKARCLDGSVPDLSKGMLACALASPVLNAPVCAAGYAKENVPGIGNICQPIPAQWSCPLGQQASPIDNKC